MQGTSYHPDFGTEVRYELERMPEDPDAQVAQTVRRIIGLIHQDMGTPIIREYARRALELGAGDPIAGLWKLIKHSIRFQNDDVTAARLEKPLGPNVDVIEVLIRPVDQALLLELRGQGIEDCDGFEMFACCVLGALGIRSSLVTVSADPDAPARYSHVYCAVYLPDGAGGQRRIALDFSHGEFPGWECPNLGRLREWPVQGLTCTPRHALVAGLIATVAVLGAYWGVQRFARVVQA